MRMTKKGEAPKPDDAEAMAAVPSYPWDHGMKMLGTGDYDLVGNPRDGRGPDQPGAQTPAPGIKPQSGVEEKAEDGQTLTNMTGVAAPSTIDVGLPTLPAPVKIEPVPAPKLSPAPKAEGK